MLRRTHCIGMVLLLCLLTASCGLRPGDVVLIPSNYKGWVVIHYDALGQPRLGRSGSKNLIRVSASGSVETSSDMTIGYGVDEYFYLNNAGMRQAIPSERISICKAQDVCVQRFQFYSGPARVAVFFVGTSAELSKYPEPKVP